MIAAVAEAPEVARSEWPRACRGTNHASTPSTTPNCDWKRNDAPPCCVEWCVRNWALVVAAAAHRSRLRQHLDIAGGSAVVVHGAVLAAPGCPVERTASPCPAIHVPDARVVASRGDTVVAEVRSTSDGTFALTVPAGTYTLTASTLDGYRSSAGQTIQATASSSDVVTITLDSGIR